MSVIDEARSKLEAEIGRLETLYFVSTITYKREAKANYKKSKGADKPVIFEAGHWKREVAHNAGHFSAIVDDVLPKTLRETIFVRLISAHYEIGGSRLPGHHEWWLRRCYEILQTAVPD
jgi:hypothetical protein